METLNLQQLSELLNTIISNQEKQITNNDIDHITAKIITQMIKNIKHLDYDVQNEDCNEMCNMYWSIPTQIDRHIKVNTLIQNIDRELIADLPLHALWWFDNMGILNLETCYYFSDKNHISDQLILLLQLVTDIPLTKLYHPKHIAIHFLLQLVEICYTPKIKRRYFYQDTTRWTEYCVEILENFMEQILKYFYEGQKIEMFDFIELINKKRTFNGKLIEHLFKTLFNKILTYKADVDLYSAYTYQALWTTRNVSNYTVKTFSNLISKCSLKHLDTLISNKQESQINWKYVVIAISCYSAGSKNICQALKDLVNTYINDAFLKKDGWKFTRAILFIRQEALEKKSLDLYSTWYSNKFGSSSNWKTYQSRNKFLFLITVLNKLVPYEPKDGLVTHLEKRLRTPVGCYSYMINYKETLEIRQAELEQAPCISVYDTEIYLLHALEHTMKYEKITFPIEYIRENVFAFKEIVLPFLKGKPKYEIIFDLLVHVRH